MVEKAYLFQHRKDKITPFYKSNKFGLISQNKVLKIKPSMKPQDLPVWSIPLKSW